jgi:hypothetical protein
VFYCICMWKFFKNLYRRYMRCPPPPPLCASMRVALKFHKQKKDFNKCSVEKY